MPKLRDSLTARDKKILLFLWRWKLVSSSALFRKFYSTMTDRSAYNMLLRLRKRKYINTQLLRADHRSFAWGLTDKGFSVVKNLLPELDKYTYKTSNPYHDFLCSALHLGDWLLGAPDNAQVFSEQELKTFLDEFYPSWVPKMEDHRPDGYWHLNGKNDPQTIAIELELTPKSKARYEKVRLAYEYESKITNVVWAVHSSNFAQTILDKMTAESQIENTKHNFLLIPHIAKYNWDSKFILGPNTGAPLTQILGKPLMKTCVVPVLAPTHSELIKTRVYPVNS